jgi:hypothetical protein
MGAVNLPGDVRVDATVESALLSDPIRLSMILGPKEKEELPVAGFVPTVSGAEEFRIAITATENNIPLGRWNGSWIVNIEDPEKPQPTAGGDAPGDPALAPPDSWQPLALRADRAFRRRLHHTCPQARFAPPPAPVRAPLARPDDATVAAVMHLNGPRQRQSLLLFKGTSVLIGRGGKSGIQWWIKPQPFDAYQHGRVSSSHCSIKLHNDRAWLTDMSTNGTWLNGQRMAKATPELLASDDLFSPAGVVPLRVELSAVDNKVTTVMLRREDGLAGRLSYALSDGTAPIPLASLSDAPGGEPLLWIWSGSEMDDFLVFLPNTNLGWRPVQPGRPLTLGRFQITCQVLDTARDQDALLQ